MIVLPYLIVLIAGLGGFADPVLAAGNDPKMLGEQKNWRAFALTDEAGKLCYVAGTPAKKSDLKGRGSPYIMVTHRPSAKSANVVSIFSGYSYKSGSDVDVAVGAKKFKLFVKGNTAWTRDAATDNALVKAMLNGKEATVKGIPARGGTTSDGYSLAGFPTTYRQISTACKVKPLK